jgi:hypothetical protein
MVGFTELELAALRSIFSETPDLLSRLEAQLDGAVVVKRENSGTGFFATIAIADPCLPIGANQLGCETHARVVGLEHGLGFVLFMEDGYLHMLEGWAVEDTTSLDLTALTFEVYREPSQRVQ